MYEHFGANMAKAVARALDEAEQRGRDTSQKDKENDIPAGSITKCELGGTPVKVVGSVTQHYEPILDSDIGSVNDEPSEAEIYKASTSSKYETNGEGIAFRDGVIWTLRWQKERK